MRRIVVLAKFFLSEKFVPRLLWPTDIRVP